MKSIERIYLEFILSIAEPLKDGKKAYGWSVYWSLPGQFVEYKSSLENSTPFVRNRQI